LNTLPARGAHVDRDRSAAEHTQNLDGAESRAIHFALIDDDDEISFSCSEHFQIEIAILSICPAQASNLDRPIIDRDDLGNSSHFFVCFHVE